MPGGAGGRGVSSTTAKQQRPSETCLEGQEVEVTLFEKVKERVTARQAAEHYGIKVKRNGMAYCPFHKDRHSSMKVDKMYHCFACGVSGDAIDFTARLFGI